MSSERPRRRTATSRPSLRAASGAPAVGLVGLLLLLSGLLGAEPPPTAPLRPLYPWLERSDPAQAISARLSPPPGFTRDDAPPESFAAWLRGLPLRPGRPPVHLFDGTVKPNQEAHHAVLELDVGRRNLQQCADAVIRLRAEYLFARGEDTAIHFNFTSGDRADWKSWAEGARPVIAGNRVSWRAAAAPRDDSYAGFRAYLDTVFTYAGTASLAQEVPPAAALSRIAPGDFFLQGGHPGHAVLVVDAAERAADGARLFLLVQSYMPAQEVHVLRNPADPALSPWYSATLGERLVTPEWTFRPGDLRRFPETKR